MIRRSCSFFGRSGKGGEVLDEENEREYGFLKFEGGREGSMNLGF